MSILSKRRSTLCCHKNICLMSTQIKLLQVFYYKNLYLIVTELPRFLT